MSKTTFDSEELIKIIKKINARIDKLQCFIMECCSKIPINIGNGFGLYKKLSGNHWQFKSLKEGNNITITEDAETLTITSSGGGSLITYPNNQIVYGDGTTPGGITSSAIQFDGNVFQVSTTGSSSGWGQVQNVVSSGTSEAGLSLYNTGAGGNVFNLISTSNSSGIGGGKFSIGDATSSQNIFMYDSTTNIYTFPFLASSDYAIITDSFGNLSTTQLTGIYLPLAGGTMDIGSHIYFGTGGQNIAQGTFDNGTGGNQGISLTCAIGYELNWQGGHLSNWNGTYQPIITDSNIQFSNSSVITDNSAVSSVQPISRLLDDENGTHAVLWDTSNSTLRYNGSTIFDWKNLAMPTLGGNGVGLVGVDNSGNLSFTSATPDYISAIANTTTVNLSNTLGTLTADFASNNISQFTNDSAYINLTNLSSGTGISYNNLTGEITNSAPYTGVPTLDQVLTAGNTSTQPIAITNGTGISVTNGSQTSYQQPNQFLLKGVTYQGSLSSATLYSNQIWTFPNLTGTVGFIDGGQTFTSATWNGTAITDTYISSAATWNAKQAALSGTGIIKSTAGTISYLTDNSTNWDTAYTNRITSLTTAGSSGSATLSSNTLNIPTYTLSGLGGVGGSGTANQLAFFSATSTLTSDSFLTVDNTSKWLGIGMTPIMKLQVSSSASSTTLPVAQLLRPNGTGASNKAIGYPYLLIGGATETATLNVMASIGFGYNFSNVYFPFVEIGSQTTSTSGNLKGDFWIATRATTTNVAATERIRVLSSGETGFGTSAPTAIVHVKAGTATAGTAPLKLTAGTNLTTPENGAIEFDGTNIFITVGGVRKTFTIV